MMETPKKLILITGGTRGIGKGIIETLVKTGYKIVFTYVSSKELATELEEKYPEDVSGYQCNCADIEDVERLAKNIIKKEDIPYGIINNAGITRDALMYKMSSEQWNDVINVNLNAGFYVINKMLPAMMERGEGCIIQISSITAFRGNVGQTNYAATKAALIGMTKSLALETARFNIRVNVVSPGLIKTDMVDEISESKRNNMVKKVPLRRIGRVEEVSSMIKYLLEETSSYITGHNFVIDGGLSI
jgi:3-oxoacyl-[acyl-carrier protein] reductase